MSSCLKESICFQMDHFLCQALCCSAIIISSIVQMLLSWLLPQLSEFHVCGNQRWASSVTSLLTSFLIVWTPRLIKLIHMIYVCRIALFVGLFSFVCLVLGLFVWCVLSVPFFLSPAALSDGDTLWRDCAWEEYSHFLISRHTGSLSCVPEVNVSLISVTNCCILRMCF